MNRMITIKLF